MSIKNAKISVFLELSTVAFDNSRLPCFLQRTLFKYTQNFCLFSSILQQLLGHPIQDHHVPTNACIPNEILLSQSVCQNVNLSSVAHSNVQNKSIKNCMIFMPHSKYFSQQYILVNGIHTVRY